MKKNCLIIIFVSLFFISCSFSYNNICDEPLNDVSSYLNYDNLIRKAYMGGYMLYNSSNPQEGQLRNNVTLAIRLGNVRLKDTNTEYPIFIDDESNASYGYLFIKDITEKFIDFKYVIYKDNVVLIDSSAKLFINEEIDINKDGLNDLKYEKPKQKRNGLKDSLYLKFISSQDYLNTTMFSVITEQYSRNTYPMGLIGINPDGKFIVSIYENNSSNRSSLLGIRYGDYAFDSKEQTYKKVITNKKYNEARTIYDEEVEVVDNPETVNFYFSKDNFNDTEMIKNLHNLIFKAYNNSSFNLVVEDDEYINLLNNFLLKTDLIEKLKEYYLLDLPNELMEIDIISLSEDGLVSLNRLFLSEYFPELSPAVDFNNNSLVDVFPLLSVLIPRGQNQEEIVERASTYNSYIEERNKIKEEMDSYFLIDLESIPNQLYDNNIVNMHFKIGIYGKYSISWSNIEGKLAAICFIQSETSLKISKKIAEGSLLPSSLKILDITKDFMIGYIPFSVGITSNFDINYKISCTFDLSNKFFAGFTGMYGGEIILGADYGTRWEKWFKIWKTWFYKLRVYVSPYVDAEIINKTTYFAGIQEDLTGFNNVKGSITAEISPKIDLTPKIGIAHNTLWIGVTTELGVKFGLLLDYDVNRITKDIFQTKAFIDLFLKLKGSGGIHIKLPFISEVFNKDFSIFSVPLCDERLAEWRII